MAEFRKVGFGPSNPMLTSQRLATTACFTARVAGGQATWTDGRAPDIELSSLWKALPDAVYDDVSRTLHVSTGFNPLADCDTIYVRDCHTQLTRMALEMTPSNPAPGCIGTGSDFNKMLVTGTPGTGKTFWQLHLLWHLAREGLTVVLDWSDSSLRYLLSSSGCYSGDKAAFMDELCNPNTWYLVDAQVPMAHCAITLETSVPEWSKTGAFINRGAHQKVMPPWRLSELEGAMHLFPGVEKDRLHDLHRKWGGSICWCLANALVPESETWQIAFINSTDVSELQRTISGRAGLDQVLDLPVHMIPDPQSLMWSHYDFASEHVADQVFWRLLNRGRSELEVFLSRTYGLPELAHVRSRLFERFVHHVLPLGGKYELRDLQSGTTSTVDLHPRQPVQINSLLEVVSHPDDAYCMPISQIQKSIGFICQPDEMGQVTTNFDHGTEAAGLEAAHEVLSGPWAGKQAWLTFVVPPDKFASFKKQKIPGPLLMKKLDIRQRVMKMPLVSRATRSVPMPTWQFF